MEFQIAEAIELIKTLAETENLTQSQALTAFVAEAGLDIEYASELKAALFEEYTLTEMASDTMSKALHSVFVAGAQEELSEMDTKETQEGTKYKVRVQDRASGSSYVRYATREKIAELRANPNISSVEITSHGETGADDSGQRTAAAKTGRDYDGDGKKESSSKEHAGVVHNAIQRKMGGTPDGKDTRKEEVEVEEGIDFKGAKREDDRRKKVQDEKDKKSPSSKDYRLAMGKFRPGASKEERAEGGRDVMREKGTSPKKDGKKMFEAYLEARAEIAEARAKTKEEARKKLDAHQAAMKDGGKSPYFGDTKKGEGKDPWSSHPSDAKAHKKEDMGEGYKGKHGQSDEEHMDSRSDAGKMISGDSKMSGAKYTHGRRVSDGDAGPAKPNERQKAQGKMDSASREDLKYRKANLKKKEEDKKKTQKEEFIPEADIYDAGRENSSQRDKVKSGKKVDGKGVDNSTRVKLMPTMEAVVTETKLSNAQSRIMGAKQVNEALRTKIQELALKEEDGGEKKYCKLCKKEETRSECSYGGKAWDENTTSEKKESIELDAAGMPISETKQESRNNARPGPSKDMIDPPADPLGDKGHMNPKGKPKRYKERGEAPGDRRPNDPTGPDLPNEKGTVPNGSGV